MAEKELEIDDIDDIVNGEIKEALKEKEKQEEKLKEPDMYCVLLHNDHYTTMEFVVEVLINIFNKQLIEAEKIMLDVHRKGRSMVGVYTYDIAATKIVQVQQMAKKREYPLKCTMEKE